MSDHFRIQGRSLLSNGYLIVPIRKGEKRPAIAGWQKARLGMDDLSRHPEHGVGVLCGQGAYPIVGVDIDVSHPTIGPALISWCQSHLGYGGERVGAAPRILLAYRADRPGWAKGASVQFYDAMDPFKPSGKDNHQQVEILGLGQQFVAYHEHPDTHQDYQWVDLFGGLEAVRASDLPVVTEAQIEALLAEVMRLVRNTPGVDVVGSAESPAMRSASDEDDLSTLTATVGMPFAEAAQWLSYLENDGDSYDHWLHVGMSLHHEYAGTEHEQDALDLWREYGARSSKDQPGEYEYKWKSFGRAGGTPTTLRWLLKICGQAKREKDHESRRAALDEAKALIKEQTDSLQFSDPAWLKRIQALIPDDPLVRTELVGTLQAHYKTLTKTTLPITQARALLIGPRAATVQAKRPLTEFGNAERMLDRYGDGLMFVPEIERWFIWTGVYWRAAVNVEIEHLAKETIRALVNERDDHEEAAEFFQFCAISQQARMVSNMVKLATSDPRVAVPARELDKHGHLLGVKNGVVDLRTGRLLPPDPDLHITLTCSCDYDPSAKAPLFERTLSEVFSCDADMVEYVTRTFGYALMGNPIQDIMFIAFGNGSNGKSTIFNAVRQVFGSYARSADPNSFISDGKQRGGGGPREDIVRLLGARFVYVNEPDENGELREGMVKSMTGGDTITARGVHAKNSVEITPTWVVYMPTNHKPIIKGNDNGIWRRMGLLPFERNFDNDKTIVKDEKRREKLLAEMPGILALLVRAALRYQRDGLTMPARAQAARDTYRSQMDLLAEWLDEFCEVDSEATASATELWESWEMFARRRGLLTYIRSSTALGRRLDPRFPAARGPTGGRIRVGLRIKSAQDLF